LAHVFLGLEFNDVLLYRFFSDLQATESQWRVVLSLLNDSKLLVPKLDARKHSIILNELRNLYVAVTRARNRLWIFDTSAKAGPMKTLLAQRGLVQICKPTDPRPQMATSSSPSEWQATALKLFNQQLYSQSAK
jgi:ATP-dependent exoDNAse (exonuclease V) beta subunit